MNRILNEFCDKLEFVNYSNNPSYEINNFSVLSIHPNDKKCYLYIRHLYFCLYNKDAYTLSQKFIIDFLIKRFELRDYDIKIR